MATYISHFLDVIEVDDEIVGVYADAYYTKNRVYFKLTATVWLKMVEKKRREYADLEDRDKPRLKKRMGELKEQFKEKWPREEMDAAEAFLWKHPSWDFEEGVMTDKEIRLATSWATAGRGSGKEVAERYDVDLLRECWAELAEAEEKERVRVKAWFDWKPPVEGVKRAEGI